MTQLVEDRALLDAFRRGERAAMEAVYREYARRLFAFLTTGFSYMSQGRTCVFGGYREPWELEGTVQEVFARAFADSARQAYDGLRPYQNYLFTIARNLVIDRFRRQGRETLASSDDAADLAMEEEDAGHRPSDPERDAAERELQGRVEAFVGRLERGEQDIFEQRFRKGQSIEAVAGVLGVSEHRVKAVERKLKKRFFHEMRRHGYFQGLRYSSAGLDRALLLLAMCSGGLR